MDICDVIKSTEDVNVGDGSSVESLCFSILTDEDSDTKHELLHCDKCNAAIYEEYGVTWMRCTTCIECNICWDCWYKGKHREHQSQITVYTWHSGAWLQVRVDGYG